MGKKSFRFKHSPAGVIVRKDYFSDGKIVLDKCYTLWYNIIMTIKQKAVQKAEKIGVQLEISGGRYFEVVGDAPAGKVFVGCGLHNIVNAVGILDNPRAVWNATLEDMKMGVKECEEADCDVCE